METGGRVGRPSRDAVVGLRVGRPARARRRNSGLNGRKGRGWGEARSSLRALADMSKEPEEATPNRCRPAGAEAMWLGA